MGWLLLVAALYAAALGWLSPRNLREAWRGPDALTGELDVSLACDLVTDFVDATEYRRKVECGDLLEVTGDAARFSGVLVGREPRTYCLARLPQWQVLRQTRGVPCFPTRPDPARPAAFEHERVAEYAKTQLARRLEAIRQAMTSEVRPLKCTPRAHSKAGSLPLLEFELLQAGAADEAWAFLSTKWLRAAVVEGGPEAILTATERWSEGRPWVAVITSSTRKPAMLGPGGGMLGWTRGQLTGTMSIVDAEAGELLCEAPFQFESSRTLLPPLPPLEKKGRFEISPNLVRPTSARVREDFEERSRLAAERAVNELTSYAAWPATQ